jgi:flagellar assembly factor FliW
MAYREDSVFEFPDGLPAFENETRFVPIEMEQYSPLIFLQSASQSGLCFLTFPILVVDREYRISLTAEDRLKLHLAPDRQPELRSEVAVLALLSLHDGFSATANLMAPIVVNLKTRQALQAIRQDSAYSHEYPVRAAAKVC